LGKPVFDPYPGTINIHAMAIGEEECIEQVQVHLRVTTEADEVLNGVRVHGFIA
jgi:hypothetical protein